MASQRGRTVVIVMGSAMLLLAQQAASSEASPRLGLILPYTFELDGVVQAGGSDVKQAQHQKPSNI